MFYWYYPLATNMQTQGANTLCVLVLSSERSRRTDLCVANIDA